MSDAPDEVYVWHSGHPDSVQDSGIWTTSREPAKHHALIEYRRADLVDTEVERLRRERQEMQAHIDALQARVHLCAGYEKALALLSEARDDVAECASRDYKSKNKAYYAEFLAKIDAALAGGEK